eukprot:TRINITY_DN24647_c0_g1_i1.p1 TRINITY_DN24647_c0_g1~~TRINITY_DN24647_c0_g1_i1.p1  ORF type:complete len:426 (-),score=87.30 TRINITY_DN24647_c0_g1_i1:14-1291(-)
MVATDVGCFEALKAQVGLLESRTLALRDSHEALCDCLEVAGVVPAERLLARLHRRRFLAALRRYPCGSVETLENIALNKELMLLTAAWTGPRGTSALGSASRGLSSGMAAVAAELKANVFPVELYAVGGEAAGSALSSVERFDSGTGSWSTCPPLQIARSGCAAVAMDGSIYALGGCGVEGEDLNSVERLRPSSRCWEHVASMHDSRDELAAAAASGQLFVVGGSHLDWPVRHVINTVESFAPDRADGAEWVQLPPLSRERCAAAAVAVAGSIIALGGCDEEGAALDTAEALDIADPQRWRALPCMPRPRCNFAAAVVSGRVYVAGGYDTMMRDLDCVECFDPRVLTWESISTLSIPRWGVRAAGGGGMVFVVGGQAFPDDEVGMVDCLDPKSGEWTRLSTLVTARRSFGLAACYVGSGARAEDV